MNALNAAGPQAARIAGMSWLLIGVCGLVFLLVMAALAWAVVRARTDATRAMPAPLAYPGPERLVTASIGVAVGVTIVVLAVFLVSSVSTGHAIAALPRDNALSIRLIGHQWWWEVEYEDAVAARRFTTANEIHVPVGRTVHVTTESRDVIHSFWVPNLHGKRDLVPGRPSEIVFRADRPGTFGGMCAEFCGLQHAHMKLLVVAEAPETFEAWSAAQRRPAPPPANDVARKGEQVFVNGACALCHTVRGSDAGGRFGPDLTHVASRATLAAGTMPNTTGHLGGWLVDAQRIKPGVNMPAMALTPDELNGLLAYLGGLR